MPFDPTKDRAYGSTSQVTGQLFKEVGGVPRVMELLELSRTRCYAMADPDDPAEISYSRVAALTKAGATAAAEHLAALAGGTFLPVATEGDGRDWHALAAESVRLAGALTSTMVESLGPDARTPGTVDAAEARELLRRVDDLMAVLAEQHRMLQAVLSD